MASIRSSWSWTRLESKVMTTRTHKRTHRRTTIKNLLRLMRLMSRMMSKPTKSRI